MYQVQEKHHIFSHYWNKEKEGVPAPLIPSPLDGFHAAQGTWQCSPARLWVCGQPVAVLTFTAQQAPGHHQDLSDTRQWARFPHSLLLARDFGKWLYLPIKATCGSGETHQHTPIQWWVWSVRKNYRRILSILWETLKLIQSNDEDCNVQCGLPAFLQLSLYSLCSQL